jgi:Cu+-exporting ATPase
MGIAKARKLSEAVMSNIRQNLFFAFIYNSGRSGGGRVLYPVFGLLLSPLWQRQRWRSVSVSVIANLPFIPGLCRAERPFSGLATR